jgi:hypothetical protein
MGGLEYIIGVVILLIILVWLVRVLFGGRL